MLRHVLLAALTSSSFSLDFFDISIFFSDALDEWLKLKLRKCSQDVFQVPVVLIMNSEIQKVHLEYSENKMLKLK
jgi:hypothetical protein